MSLGAGKHAIGWPTDRKPNAEACRGHKLLSPAERPLPTFQKTLGLSSNPANESKIVLPQVRAWERNGEIRI
jgi:hypothetical protein